MIKIHLADRVQTYGDHALYGVCYRVTGRHVPRTQQMVRQLKLTGEATFRGIRVTLEKPATPGATVHPRNFQGAEA